MKYFTFSPKLIADLSVELADIVAGIEATETKHDPNEVLEYIQNNVVLPLTNCLEAIEADYLTSLAGLLYLAGYCAGAMCEDPKKQKRKKRTIPKDIEPVLKTLLGDLKPPQK